MVVRDEGGEGKGKLLFNGARVCLRDDKIVLGIESDDGYITL